MRLPSCRGRQPEVRPPPQTPTPAGRFRRVRRATRSSPRTRSRQGRGADDDAELKRQRATSASLEVVAVAGLNVVVAQGHRPGKPESSKDAPRACDSHSPCSRPRRLPSRAPSVNHGAHDATRDGQLTPPRGGPGVRKEGASLCPTLAPHPSQAETGRALRRSQQAARA